MAAPRSSSAAEGCMCGCRGSGRAGVRSWRAWVGCLQRCKKVGHVGAERRCGHQGCKKVRSEESLACGESNARLCSRLLVVSRLCVELALVWQSRKARSTVTRRRACCVAAEKASVKSKDPRSRLYSHRTSKDSAKFHSITNAFRSRSYLLS